MSIYRLAEENRAVRERARSFAEEISPAHRGGHACTAPITERVDMTTFPSAPGKTSRRRFIR